MSSWTSLGIDGYEISSSRSYASHEDLAMFREGDKRLRVRVMRGDIEIESPWLAVDEINALPWRRDGSRWFLPVATAAGWMCQGQVQLDESVDEVEADADLFVVSHAYITTAQIARDRLDAMGFTVPSAKTALEQTALDTRMTLLDSYSGEEFPEYLRDEVEALRELTLDRWFEAYRWIAIRGAHTVEARDEHIVMPGYQVHERDTSPLVRYLLSENGEHVYGFPYDAFRLLLRAALETCDPSAEVILDLSSVTSAGYYGWDDAVIDDGRAAALATYPSDAPVVVLTEGSTDRDALAAALGLLYPHLADIYTFMDFKEMRVAGGAGQLAEMIKAFAGAGIANRIVAFFDNDTAGAAALAKLRTVVLPQNIRVLRYPDVSIASSYPTLGPTGPHVMDVNGSAASIEMYFGEDVLRDVEGALIPVVWSSMDRSVGRYQGELIDKELLQRRFREKVKAASDSDQFIGQDWTGLHLILNALRSAFMTP